MRYARVLGLIVLVATAEGTGWRPLQAQSPVGPPLYPLNDDAYRRFPLPASARQYGSIDGTRMKADLNELVAISEKSRQDGHQFWGRITGTPYDAMSRQWVAARFRKIGLETHEEPMQLPPIWFPKKWEFNLVTPQKTVPLKTAQAVRESPSSAPGGVRAGSRVGRPGRRGGLQGPRREGQGRVHLRHSRARHARNLGKRRRSISFVSFATHHEPDELWRQWMMKERRSFLSNTALIMNCEHTALSEFYTYAGTVRWTNGVAARRVSVLGSDALAATLIKDLNLFGVTTYFERDVRALGEVQTLAELAPGFQTIRDGVFYHSDRDTADKVPAVGLEALARAYAKLIDDVNGMETHQRGLLPRRRASQPSASSTSLTFRSNTAAVNGLLRKGICASNTPCRTIVSLV